MNDNNLFVDYSNPIPIFHEIYFDREKNPFGLTSAKRVECCKSLRCEKIEFIPHSHSTHLETDCHINLFQTPAELDFNLSRPLMTKIITFGEDLKTRKWDEMVEFLIFKKIRPKMESDFEGIPIDFLQRAARLHPKAFVFGVNEPSFDPEIDGGKMRAHKEVFSSRDSRYIIEALNLDLVPSDSSKYYYCFLNIFRYGKSDAYPCSPILYERNIPVESEICDKIMVLSDSCIFCKIIRGVIPSFKIYENNLTFAFLDINPLSEGHIVSKILTMT